MNRRFLRQMKTVHQDFIEMGLEAAEAIQKATTAFKEHDLEMADQIIQHDEVINNLEIKLEKRTSQLIALQQPVATNLRRVITILKASSDVERIGDHAVEIAKAVKRISNKRRNDEIEELIGEISVHTQNTLTQIVAMFAQHDRDGAIELAKKTRENKEHFVKIRNIAIKAIKEDSQFASEGIDYLNIVSHIKRIDDYIINLAEWIIYEKDGKIAELDV